ncbi:MAG: radical SAM protein [Terracidiphilus sp.]
MLPRLTTYPNTARERDQWILARRGMYNAVDARVPYAYLVEDERNAAGEIVPTATIFLTNRECPWRCLMCDLWRNTISETVPAGAIPQQIDYALERIPAARQIKLYNSGSFFDPRAIPPEDYEAIARRLDGFDRVIVECHPALVGDACARFRDLIRGKFEVAMGLETAHREILELLNKHMTLEMFAESARLLRESEIDLRAFILVKPPFMREEESVDWAVRSLEYAFECGATAASLIPTRGGNGTMEELAAADDFSSPALRTLVAAFERGILLKKGRVFADLWNAETWPGCHACRGRRIARLRDMNLEQRLLEAVACDMCKDEA